MESDSYDVDLEEDGDSEDEISTEFPHMIVIIKFTCGCHMVTALGLN